MKPLSQINLLQTANDIAGSQNYPQATLYLVPTPIGNLADITLRSLHTLTLVDAIACEDTRQTHMLLTNYGIENKTLFALHQHNEQQATVYLLDLLAQNKRIALVTDAGTPAISDPGARAVFAVQKAGFRIMPLPGASSVITALSAAGIVDSGFLFHGFLPSKTQERKNILSSLLGMPYAFVLLEAPHRITDLAVELAQAAPQRTITIARELTKQFEQIITLTAQNLPSWLNERNEHRKGEFVCIIHATNTQPTAQAAAYDEALTQALAYMPTKAATLLIANLTGISKNTLYERALQLKKNN